MTNYDNELQNIIDRGYEFKFNQYIRDGFDLFSKNVGGFVGFYVLVFAISLFSSLILSGVGNIIQPVLLAGAFIVANEIIQGRTPDFSKFFQGFNHFLQLILFSIVSSIFIVVGFILLIVPGMYLAISYQFASMIIVFLGYDFWPAMEFSRKIITKQWWSFFGFMIVLALINVAGLIALGVGILFTAPATTCMIFCAFEDIVGNGIKQDTSTNNFTTNNNYTSTSI